ncbi:MAG: hypothetical protein NZ773_15740 [Dehalococcoidia bacterium]|nr:hypothetical protein [Dehalococcoidia bacterium]
MNHDALVARYRTVGTTLREAVARLSPRQLTLPDADGKSPLDRIIYLHRYSLALNRWIDGITTLDRPSLPALVADLPAGDDRPVAVLVEEFDAESQRAAAKLAALDDAAWQRQCVRTNGEVTELEGLVTRLADEYDRVLQRLQQGT